MLERTRLIPRARDVGALVVGALVVGALVLVAAVAPPASAQLDPPPAEPQPRAWILVDADTGEILGTRNEHEAMLVASTTKLMTAITALERLTSDTVLTVSERAAVRPAFNMNMQAGEQWLLAHVLSAALIVSANDAAYVLAEGSGGSIEAFAEQMTATGERLGLRDSTFTDPAGLDGEFSYGGGSLVSAYDLAIVGRNALAIPAIAERAATEREVLEDLAGVTRVLPTRNSVFLGLYEGATGLKTGGTDSAGSTLVASATRDGRTLIAVVLGAPATAQWAGMLLDRGFAGQVVGTGDTLPPVHVVTADGTRDAVAGMPRLLGRPDLDLDGTVLAASDVSAQVAPEEPVLQASERDEETSGGSGGGTGWLRNVAVGAVLALVLIVWLRRRAVKRRNRRRLARQQALAEARRRGMIDVIDPNDQARGTVQVMRSRRRSR